MRKRVNSGFKSAFFIYFILNFKLLQFRFFLFNIIPFTSELNKTIKIAIFNVLLRLLVYFWLKSRKIMVWILLNFSLYYFCSLYCIPLILVVDHFLISFMDWSMLVFFHNVYRFLIYFWLLTQSFKFFPCTD